ncbi:MAG: flagellar type III secretion system pore protein FliP [candidate division KSB1 bacterium]|nr:flagellar type III secretion system pore protein FliP [candidate division KSB1 bacterium]
MIAFLKKNSVIAALLLVFCVLIVGQPALAQQPAPKVSITVDNSGSPRDVALGLELLFMFTVLALAPSILIMMTSFTRIIIVLSFLKQALGLQQMPPNQMMIGLSLFLTFFVMQPVFDQINQDAFQPYINEKISSREALEKGMAPLREFMFKQTREKDLALFVRLAKVERPNTVEDVPTHVLIPAFIISELRLAFQIGFLLYIPFLMIDMIVASVLMSMGMLMLPPIMISLPFKLLLFVLVDGWYLVIGSVIDSIR